MNKNKPFVLVDQDIDSTDRRVVNGSSRALSKLSTVAIALGMTMMTACTDGTDGSDCNSDSNNYDSDSYDTSRNVRDTKCD